MYHKTSQIKLKNTANPPAVIGLRYFVTFLRKQDPFQKVIFCFEGDSFLAEQGNCVFCVTSFLGCCTKYQKLGGFLKKRNVLSLNSGSQKSEIKATAGPCSLYSFRGGSFLASSSCECFLAVPDGPRPVDTSLQPHGHLLPVSVCLHDQVSLLLEDTSLTGLGSLFMTSLYYLCYLPK